MEEAFAGYLEPMTWILVFKRTAKHRAARLIPGRYKHVAAYAFLPNAKAWLVYDVHQGGMLLAGGPDGPEMCAALGEMTADADLMSMPRRPAPMRPLRIGTCVGAMKHLIGLRSSALLPTGLWADCLRAGGEPLMLSQAVDVSKRTVTAASPAVHRAPA